MKQAFGTDANRLYASRLLLACVLYVAIVWTAERLRLRAPIEAPPRIRASAIGLLGLVLAQIYLGKLVAGLDAGLAYNSWPLIEERLVPAATELFSMQPLWRNVFENRLTVQFISHARLDTAGVDVVFRPLSKFLFVLKVVGEVGLEPTKAKPADLQSAPFAARDTPPAHAVLLY